MGSQPSPPRGVRTHGFPSVIVNPVPLGQQPGALTSGQAGGLSLCSPNTPCGPWPPHVTTSLIHKPESLWDQPQVSWHVGSLTQPGLFPPLVQGPAPRKRRKGPIRQGTPG